MAPSKTKLRQTNLSDMAQSYLKLQAERQELVEKHLKRSIDYFNDLTWSDVRREEIKVVYALHNGIFPKVRATMSKDGTMVLYPVVKGEDEIASTVPHEVAHYVSNVLKNGRLDEKGKLAIGLSYKEFIIQNSIEEAGGYLSGYLYNVQRLNPLKEKAFLAREVINKIKSWAGFESNQITSVGVDPIGYALQLLFLDDTMSISYVPDMVNKFFDMNGLKPSDTHYESNVMVQFAASLGQDIALVLLAENNFDVFETVRYVLSNSYGKIRKNLGMKSDKEIMGSLLRSLRK